MTTKFTFYKLFAALFTVLFGLLAAVPAAQATGGKNLKAIGLTQGGVLVSFLTGSGKTQDIGFISGLQGDASLIGIDFRVQDGLLYGVGDGGVGPGAKGGIYTIDPKTAVAKLIDRLDVPFDMPPFGGATFFGVDFNPAANALRIISDTGQNLRHPFANPLNPGPTVSDGTLSLVAPPNPPVTPALGVTAAAYTNNDDATAVPGAASTGTTLFDIDTKNDQVVIQSPANAGLLVRVGSLGVDAGPVAGFDIFSRLRKGVTVDNFGFASLFVNGQYSLYRINLLTGNATTVDAFDDQVVDLAIRLKQ